MRFQLFVIIFSRIFSFDFSYLYKTTKSWLFKSCYCPRLITLFITYANYSCKFPICLYLSNVCGSYILYILVVIVKLLFFFREHKCVRDCFYEGLVGGCCGAGGVFVSSLQYAVTD